MGAAVEAALEEQALQSHPSGTAGMHKPLQLCLRMPALAASLSFTVPPPSYTCRLRAGHWVLVEGGEGPLKEALLTKGPMVVSSELRCSQGPAERHAAPHAAVA